MQLRRPARCQQILVSVHAPDDMFGIGDLFRLITTVVAAFSRVTFSDERFFFAGEDAVWLVSANCPRVWGMRHYATAFRFINNASRLSSIATMLRATASSSSSISDRFAETVR